MGDDLLLRYYVRKDSLKTMYVNMYELFQMRHGIWPEYLSYRGELTEISSGVLTCLHIFVRGWCEPLIRTSKKWGRRLGRLMILFYHIDTSSLRWNLQIYSNTRNKVIIGIVDWPLFGCLFYSRYMLLLGLNYFVLMLFRAYDRPRIHSSRKRKSITCVSFRIIFYLEE